LALMSSMESPASRRAADNACPIDTAGSSAFEPHFEHVSSAQKGRQRRVYDQY